MENFYDVYKTTSDVLSHGRAFDTYVADRIIRKITKNEKMVFLHDTIRLDLCSGLNLDYYVAEYDGGNRWKIFYEVSDRDKTFLGSILYFDEDEYENGRFQNYHIDVALCFIGTNSDKEIYLQIKKEIYNRIDKAKAELDKQLKEYAVYNEEYITEQLNNVVKGDVVVIGNSTVNPNQYGEILYVTYNGDLGIDENFFGRPLGDGFKAINGDEKEYSYSLYDLIHSLVLYGNKFIVFKGAYTSLLDGQLDKFK